MKCDKCGFEHNSRSTCPKCGASVIYVNEDYARKRKEWEEANKAGKAGSIPPGIMYSTKEEHDIRQGKDRTMSLKENGGPETPGLSFGSLKTSLINFIAGIIVKCKRKKDAKKADKKLEFSDKPDTLDTSKLVLSHKVFKDHKKAVITGVLAFIILAVGIPVTVHNIKRIDRSKVLLYDGQNIFYANDAKNPLYSGKEGTAFEVGTDSLITVDADGFCVFSGKKLKRVDTKLPEILAYNRDASAILYMSEGSVYFYDGESKKLDTEGANSFPIGTMISDNGAYFALTLADKSVSSSEYFLYYGDKNGVVRISADNKQKTIIDVNDDGGVLYLDMDEAAYGIINSRAVSYFDGEKNEVFVNDIADYHYIKKDKSLYYTDREGGLYLLSDKKISKLDSNVDSFCENMFDEEVYYLKEDGCYRAEKDKDFTTPLFKTKSGKIEIFGNWKNGYIYYTENEKLFFLDTKKQLSPKLIADASPDDLKFTSDKSKLYALTADKKLLLLSGKTQCVTMDADSFFLAGDSVFYTKSDRSYLCFKKGKKTIEIKGITENKSISSVVFSRKNVYVLTKENGLFKASIKTKSAKLAGSAKICIFVG